MLAFCWYMLKVIICSGILFGYYWVFLRNKIFHRYNRFYLLSAIVLSLLLPLLKIGFWQPADQQSQVIRALQVVSAGDDYLNNLVVSSPKSSWQFEDLYPLLYAAVSMGLLLVMIRTLLLIRSLLRKYPIRQVEEMTFVNTEDNSTPFSFLRYIFWNNSIDIDTTTGRQIFKHEVAHIRERHTHDKLFMNLILVVCWCNPFFWLYRKELHMIHEFIADQKAVEDSDTASFAAMILQAAYPRHRFELANNFFYSPIKRRLLMLTKNNNPKVNYLGRIMVLPLALLVFAAFTFKTRPAVAKDFSKMPATGSVAIKDTIPVPGMFINVKNADSAYLHSDEFQHKALVIIDSKEIGNTGNEYLEHSGRTFSSIVIYAPAQARALFCEKGKYGVIKAAQKEVTCITAQGVIVDEKNDMLKLVGPNIDIKGNLSSALICVEGKEVTQDELNKIPPEKISSINIMKGEKLKDYVDTKGKTALIQVNLKPEPLDEVVVVGYPLKEVKETTDQPVAIAVDKMNVLYIGVDNPITVAVPGVPSDQLLVHIDQGSISGSKGKYTIRVTTPGETTIKVLTVRDDRKVLLSSQTFRVKTIPDPANGNIPIDMDVKYKVDSAQLMLAKSDWQMQQEAYKQQLEVKMSEQQLATLKQKLVTDQSNYVAQSTLLEEEKRKMLETKALSAKLQTTQQQKLKLAQEQKLYITNRDNMIFGRVEISPSFTGGDEAWKRYLMKNLDAGIPLREGWKPGKYSILVSFIVRADGTLADIQTENYKNTKTANHCIEIIRNSPRWQPAIQNGKKVNAYHRQPITFVVSE